MKKIAALTLLLLLALAATACAGTQFVDPAEFKKWLESGKKMQIVDIQVSAEFQKHHFKGAIETNAYPIKSDEDKQRLDAVVPRLFAGREDIVVICPRGGGGAKNAVKHLVERGIPAQRIYILEDGMLGWPYRELVAQTAS